MKSTSSSTIAIHPPAMIVSDLHLGSLHSRYEAFKDLLDSIEEPTALIFNGDTFDRPVENIDSWSREVLDKLLAHPFAQPYFIRGNHDEDSPLFAANGFTLYENITISVVNMLICHGDDFQLTRPHHRLFLFLFRRLHGLRVLLGAPSVHVAEYAKRWSVFYHVLRGIVRDNATDFARENDVSMIVCGHVHFAEDTEINGIRYINSGCWTEPKTHYLSIREGEVKLCEWTGRD